MLAAFEKETGRISFSNEVIDAQTSYDESSDLGRSSLDIKAFQRDSEQVLAT